VCHAIVAQGCAQAAADAIALHRIAGLFCDGEAEAAAFGLRISWLHFRLQSEGRIMKARALGNGEELLALFQPPMKCRGLGD
jgi:hypothetical protein